MGVEYEIVSAGAASWRTAVIEGTGQSAVPAIELEDGTWYREDSARDGSARSAPGARARPPERRYTFPLAGL